jgi:hypothetical protein
MRFRLPWSETPAAHFCDGGTERQARNLLRRSNVTLPEVVGPASTLRGHEMYLRMHREFPRCLNTLEAMGREKGLIV